jgi:YbbR domain-containing protein
MGQPSIFQSSASRFSENFGFKIIALFITLILWLTILGQRDFVITKVVNLEVLTDPNYVVVGQTAEEVTLRLAGPRAILRKWQDAGLLKEVTLTIPEPREGLIELEIPVNKIELPSNVKLVNFRPHKIRVEMMRKDHMNSGSLKKNNKSNNNGESNE